MNVLDFANLANTNYIIHLNIVSIHPRNKLFTVERIMNGIFMNDGAENTENLLEKSHITKPYFFNIAPFLYQ